MKKRYLGIDFETYSEQPIASVGSYRYIDDPSFEPLLLSYAYDDEPVSTLDFTAGDVIPDQLRNDLLNPEIVKTAYNAAFERYILSQYFGWYMPPEQWEDTMILVAQCGLPLSLGEASKALNLGEEEAKMAEGKRLIRYFCCPCKATKANGGRTRNLPEHNPEDWETFKTYNGRDVVAERAIRKLLEPWKPSEIEHRFWCLDARVNEHGMGVDKSLAEQAIDFDNRVKGRLTEEAIALTGMDNPKSVSQIKAWLLEQEDIEVPTLNKKAVADVVAQLKTDEARQFMAIRAELSKTSTKKYEAMLRCLCPDGHAKGCFQFYGANRTGRFSGRNIQLQNLPQNHMQDLAAARSLVRRGDFETTDRLYDNISSMLSELIRTALIPEPGCRFIVADFSAIEARVLAWFAGEQWRMDVFKNGGDIYCASASQMFKVPVVKHGVNGELRAKGKIAELACIAAGQKVLTDRGLVKIEDVLLHDLVWDGERWVGHDGVVCQGIKEVFTYDGLTATGDHLVYVEGKPGPIRFDEAASSGARLRRSFSDGEEIWACRNNLPGEVVDEDLEPLLGLDEVSGLRVRSVDGSRELEKRAEQRLSILFPAKERLPEMAVQEGDCAETALREPGVPGVQKLWGKGNFILLPVGHGSLPMGDRESGGPERSELGVGPDRQRRKLCPRKSTLGDAPTEYQQSEMHKNGGLEPQGMAVCPDYRISSVQNGSDTRRDTRPRLDERRTEMQELERHPSLVYDIVNAGPEHRFTVSGVLVHNCGYGGGIGALKNFGADKMGMSQQDMVDTIDRFRTSSPNIVKFWSALERAAIRCVVRGTHTELQMPHAKISFDMESGILWMTLPSARRIAYYGAKYERSRWNRERKVLSYMGTDQKTKKWCRVETWGGKLTENLVQATARDCLRDSMLAIEDQGYDIRAHVHDEVILSVPTGQSSVEEVCGIMGQTLPWAPGLPLKADGYETPYYKKDD